MLPETMERLISSIRYFQITKVNGIVIPEITLTMIVLIKLDFELFHNNRTTLLIIKKNSLLFLINIINLFINFTPLAFVKGDRTYWTISFYSYNIVLSLLTLFTCLFFQNLFRH